MSTRFHSRTQGMDAIIFGVYRPFFLLHMLDLFVIHINRNKPNFKYVANKYEIKDTSKKLNTCFSCNALFNHTCMMFIIL